MLHDQGSMDPGIRPLWRTHIVGFARTMRYVPTDKKIPDMSPDEYTTYAYDYWYGEVTNDGLAGDILPGDIVTIDASDTNVGIMGSNVVLAYLRGGAQGIVTNAGCRDTDEVIMQRTPVWSRYCSQTMNQGRVEFDTKNVPINCGGVVVRPEDIVVADGDGVVVVPLAKAEDVAKYARQELDNDKAGRRKHYEALGYELDDSVV
jgi:4-hydroxy-4-methyl-2-oxoglutarate aldolase